MSEGLYIAIISGAVALLSIVLTKGWDWFIKHNEQRTAFQGKEFDDGVERRKELLKEIESLRNDIKAKDEHIQKMQNLIDGVRSEFHELSIKYTRLEGQYINALEDIQRMTTGITQHVREVKHEVINENTAKKLEDELAQMAQEEPNHEIPPHGLK